jgi:hypothetical protein
MKRVSKRQAESAARAVGRAFGAEEGYGPKLLDRAEYGDGSKGWMISWEEGPYEWPYLIHGGFNEEIYSLAAEFGKEKARQIAQQAPVKFPKDVFAEAINHYSIALYSREEYC